MDIEVKTCGWTEDQTCNFLNTSQMVHPADLASLALSIGTDRFGQTKQTQIGLPLIEKQCNLGLHVCHSACTIWSVCMGLTSLSTIFSHITMSSGCDRELSAHIYSVVSLKYHAPDTSHDTTLSHIILTLGRPDLALPSKSERQAGSSKYHF